MQQSQKEALTEISTADETIVDEIRIIRDSLITVIPADNGGLKISSPLSPELTRNEAADELSKTFRGQVQFDTIRLIQALIHEDTEAGNSTVDLFAMHDILDTAVFEWENAQKHTRFSEDPDSL